MSPPEVWGPAIWTLFHTLAEKINEDIYPYLKNSMFLIIVKICKYLPCPDCSRDASDFLARIKISDYKTKDQFKNMLYLFHNRVNAKKRKRLFNYAFMNKYANVNIINVVNNFISKYNTKGNMKLLAETFQRNFVIKDFIYWFKIHSRAFINIKTIQTNNSIVENAENEKNKHINNDSHIDKPIVEENDIVSEEENGIVTEEENGIVTEEENGIVTEEENGIVTEEENGIVTEEENGIVTEEENGIVTEEENDIVTEEENDIVTEEENDLQHNIKNQEYIIDVIDNRIGITSEEVIRETINNIDLIE